MKQLELLGMHTDVILLVLDAKWYDTEITAAFNSNYANQLTERF